MQKSGAVVVWVRDFSLNSPSVFLNARASMKRPRQHREMVSPSLKRLDSWKRQAQEWLNSLTI